MYGNIPLLGFTNHNILAHEHYSLLLFTPLCYKAAIGAVFVSDYKIGIYSMLEHIRYLPAHVLGIHAVGHVTIGDYEKTIRPLLERQVKQTGRINFLLVLETNIKNFTAGAWCGNIRLGLKYFTRWNKVAVVTDQDGVREFSHLFKYILPGKFAGYRLENLDEAVKWVTGIK